MLKQKLIDAKDFISDYRYEIGVGALVVAITGAIVAFTDPEDWIVEEKSKEVIETATHTIVLIEK